MSNEDMEQVLGPSPAESLVHRLLRKMGKLIPETADDVERAEEELGSEPIDLPEALTDPDRVFEGSLAVSLPEAHAPSPTEADADVLRGFSAAARKGSALTPEVTDKMQRDWEEAQREHEDDDGDTGQGDRGAS